MNHATQNHRPGDRPLQFSLRLLLMITAGIAVLVALSLSFYRQQEATRRAMHFRQAVRAGDLKAVDQMLNTDLRLAHGRVHAGAQSSHTALQSALGVIKTYNPKIVDRIVQEKPDVNETSSGGETALHIAARLNHLAEVRRLIQLGANLNALDEHGNTPLYMAVRSNNRSGQLLKLLLDAGAEPNFVPSNPPPEWKAPLSLAAENSNGIIVAHLLDAGAQINARDTEGRTALHFALADDHRLHDVSTLLLMRGADLTAKDEQGLIPGERSDGSNTGMAALVWWEQILQLFDKNDTAKLDSLLDAAPRAISFRLVYDPKTMLHRAMDIERLDLLDYLLARRPNPLGRDLETLPPLHDACWRHTPVQKARDLLDAGAKINVRDPFGQTPLHAAAREHNHDVLRLLLARGADVNAIDFAGATVLDTAFECTYLHDEGRNTLDLLREAGHPPTVLYAAATGNLDLLRELTRDKRELLDRVYARTGVRPLHAAVLGNQPHIIEWLLKQDIEREPSKRPDWRANWSQSPLHVALSYNLVEIALLLVHNGADVNRPSSDGYPAHLVIRWDRDPKILEALLACGADPTLTYHNKTAFQLARDSKSQHRARYLELLDSASRQSAASR